jgi:hypothetical protein
MSKDPSFETVEFEAADNSTQEFPKTEETDTTLEVAEPQHKTTASTSADGYVTSAHTTVDNPAPKFRSRQPRLAPPVKWLAILLGLALIALACVAWRDVWISYTNSPQTLWSAPVFRLIGTPPLPMWMVWAGVASMVVGLIFFIIAVRPGRMTHVPVSPSTEDGATTMWIRNVDIARLVSGTTRRIPGVSTAQTRTTGNTKKGLKVEITIAGDVDDPMLAQRVSDSAKHALKELGTKVDVSVEVEKKQELGNNV